MVDVKLKGRVEKAQSFAKAVLCSLLLLVAVGLYVRWDSLLDLSNPNGGVDTNIVVVNTKEDNDTPQLTRDTDKVEEFAKNIVDFKKKKTQLRQKQDPQEMLKSPSGDTMGPRGSVTQSSLLPVLSEQEKVDMNHPKKEVYVPVTSQLKEVNDATVGQLRYEVGNFKKELPLETISLETATKTQMTVVPTENKQMTLLTGAATG